MDEQSIFSAAVEIEDATEREAYLEQACGNDSTLRDRVEELLRVHAEAGSFMDAPAVGPAETIDPSITEGPGTVINRYKLLQQIVFCWC